MEIKFKDALGFALGVFVANGVEWYAHNHLLHGRHVPGSKRHSPTPEHMQNHWLHHRLVRKDQFRDLVYEEGLAHARNRHELLSLAVLAGGTSLLTWKLNKGFAVAAWYSAYNYFTTHRLAHISPEFGRQRMPWHYDHHMNNNQDANWCVTRPWFDYIMGTRVASSAALLESNPLGMTLPDVLEKPLNAALRKVFPSVFAKVEANLLQEMQQQARASEDTPLLAELQQVANG